MAELFLAVATRPGDFAKRLAVKRVLPELRGQDEIIEMFRDEARLAATLDHPNVIHVYDVGDEDG